VSLRLLRISCGERLVAAKEEKHEENLTCAYVARVWE
jgi:hypothetical protein